MNKIPTALRNELSEDPFYTKCCLKMFGGCNGRIEWHHALIYGGKQVQAKFCILPACHDHHDMARKTEIKERFDWVMLNRATEQEILSISKAINYTFVLDRLNTKFGKYK